MLCEIHINKDINFDMMMLKGERINKGAKMSHRYNDDQERKKKEEDNNA